MDVQSINISALPVLDWLPYVMLIIPLVIAAVFGALIGVKRQIYFLIWNIVGYGLALLIYYLLSPVQVYEMIKLALPDDIYQFLSTLRTGDGIYLGAAIGVIFTIILLVIFNVLAFAIYLPLHFTVWRKLKAKSLLGRISGAVVGLITILPLTLFMTDSSLIFSASFPIANNINFITSALSFNQFVYVASGESVISNVFNLDPVVVGNFTFAEPDGSYIGISRLILLFNKIIELNRILALN